MKNSPIKTSADIDVDLDSITLSNLPKTCREKLSLSQEPELRRQRL